MYRVVVDDLKKWKESDRRKPLLLRGARQVGKTYSVIEFGKEYFDGNVHVFNFEKNPELESIFEENLDSNRIFTELELFVGKSITSGTDLLFFDEIQECPKAIMSLRYFYEEKPDLHVIAAGSLLEFVLGEIRFPVGRLQVLYMHPMTFDEFLLATNKELLAHKIKSCKEPIAESITELVNKEMYKYFLVGGMPECVDTFVKTNSYLEVAKVQEDLLATYRQDFSKYAGHSDKRCLDTVLTSVARKAGEQIKYTKLSDEFTSPTIKKAFDLLETARLFTKVSSASPSGLPLGANISDKRFKTVFLDIGLLSNLIGFYSDRTIDKSKFQSAYNGKMAEQFVGQELRAASKGKIYYWSREAKSSSAEVDFLVESEGEIVPVEVKSGKSGSLKSLHLLLDSFPNVKKSYVLTENKYGKLEDKPIEFLPLFKTADI